MKSHIHTLLLVGILGVAPLCNAQMSNQDTSIKEVKEDTKDLLQTIGSYSVDKKNEAVEKVKNSLDKLDNRIDTLESRVDNNWDKMNKKARLEARENLKALRKQRNEVAQWYGSMKNSSANAWEHMKKGFSNAYKTLQKSWEKSEREFEIQNKK
jgi:hypothetical protein